MQTVSGTRQNEPGSCKRQDEPDRLRCERQDEPDRLRAHGTFSLLAWTKIIEEARTIAARAIKLCNREQRDHGPTNFSRGSTN